MIVLFLFHFVNVDVSLYQCISIYTVKKKKSAMRQPCPSLPCFQIILDLIWCTALHQLFLLTNCHLLHRRLCLSTLLLSFCTSTGEQPLIVQPFIRYRHSIFIKKILSIVFIKKVLALSENLLKLTQKL